MIRNYFKIAWRSLLKNKLQSGINLVGLTVGITGFMGILIYVLAQTGYDRAFTNADSIFRIRTRIVHENSNSPDSDFPSASPPIAFAMKEDFPEVEEVCRIVYINQFDTPIRPEGTDDSHYSERGYLADSTFFKVFDYPLLEGSARGALDAPESIVLSSTLASRLFGGTPALHKTVILGTGTQASRKTVTAVLDDSGIKTHLNPNYIISMNSPGLGEFVRTNQNYATQNFIYSYVKLKSGTARGELEKKLPAFLQRRGAKDLADAGFEKTLSLQPVVDIHLYSKGIGPQLDRVSDIGFLYLLLILAVAILLLGCINYINLKTAFANRRGKEIGLRKVMGAGKGALGYQFLTESLLMTLTAVLVSLPLILLLLPYINELGQTSLGMGDVFNPRILLFMGGLAVITGMLSGVYPALILSAVQPVNALSGLGTNLNAGKGNFRKALVVFQFVVSSSLIVAVIVILQQVRYGQNLDLGYSEENLLAIRLGTEEVSSRFAHIRDTFEEIPGVRSVSGSNNYPSQMIFGDFGGHLPGTDPSRSVPVHYSGIYPGYLETAGMTLLTGRDLRTNDSTQTIVNRTALEALGVPIEDALATTLVNTYEGKSESYQIVGVVEDYHYAPLTEKIAPIALFMESKPGWLLIRAESTDYVSLINRLETEWSMISAETPFEYSFIDQEVQQLFEEEQRLAKISVIFTCLAILISCLGLFGLVSYITEQRKKEIGIRKVLGASIRAVIVLLTREYIILVSIALLLAFPLAYFIMKSWQQTFTYQAGIQWWAFLLAAGLAFGITIVTVGAQSLRSASANPIKSLRTE